MTLSMPKCLNHLRDGRYESYRSSLTSLAMHRTSPCTANGPYSSLRNLNNLILVGVLMAVGAVLACLLNWLGVPALAFSLGMFIPLELNTPLLVGGAISWWVSTRSKNEEVNKARLDRGTLLASGFIAGGALMGVVSAGMRFAGFEYTSPLTDTVANWLAVVMYVALIAYLAVSCIKAKKDE